MNARFAEPCRPFALELSDVERKVFIYSTTDGRSQRSSTLTCEKDIFIGVFFDGTNNNKYRDTPGFSQSNVARLYEVFPGTPAAQAPPALLPRVLPDGSTAPRSLFPDRPFKPESVASDDFPYYRKIYVPGLGTPMPNVGDSGVSWLKTGGLAFALLGQVRLAWAQMQLVNQVHAAVFRIPLEDSIDMMQTWRASFDLARRLNPVIDLILRGAEEAPPWLEGKLHDLEATVASVTPLVFDAALARLQDRLVAALKQRGNNKPDLRKIRLSIFGFSRGAAAARAWTNLVVKRWGDSLAGIALQIDFLGLFDSVASVGFTPAIPRLPGLRPFEGHAMWAGSSYMPVPAVVRRCVHLVAALEVRGSFPLDSVCQGNSLPANCKEIVYPGVHSDVGGGYPPDDQGRALGVGAQGDAKKISQLPLAQMYREARMAGVPLAPSGSMGPDRARYFEIAPQLREDFNAYVAATRAGRVPPTEGKGEAAFARMYPTETQPREELFRVMRRHYGIMLRWRKKKLAEAGGSSRHTDGAAGLPCLLQTLKDARSDSRFQDIEDLREAEAELVKEIAFLKGHDPQKFASLDDPLAAGSYAGLVPVLGLIPCWVYQKAFPEVMREKQREWDTWIHQEWFSTDDAAQAAAAGKLFESYVHDSRAWFKPMFRTDKFELAPDDESWFVLGGRERGRSARIATLERVARLGIGADRANAEAELSVLRQDGQPLIKGGREPYQMWGYLRHRAIYQSGKLLDSTAGDRQRRIDAEENHRVLERSRSERRAAEEARHRAELDKLLARNREVILANPNDEARVREFTDGTRRQIDNENRFHQEQLRVIAEETRAS